MGKGTGDLNIQANCGIIVSESYPIVDATYSHLNEWVENQSSTANTFHRKNWDSNLSLTLPSDFELSFKAKSTMTNAPRFWVIPVSLKNENTNVSYGFGVYQTSTTARGTVQSGESGFNSVSINSDYQQWKIVREGNTLTWYLNDVLNGSKTISDLDSHSPYLFALTYWQGGIFYVKDIILKPL